MYRAPLPSHQLKRGNGLTSIRSFIKTIRRETSHRTLGGPRDKVKMMSTRQSASWVSVALLVCAALSPAPAHARCRLRRHVHKALQTDLTGRRCWDDVRIQSCWGYCLSYEISDWRFPYKESHHPVCSHGERRHASVKLQHCDPGAEPGTDVYHYIEAKSCKCQACSSEDTSCEWLPPDSNLLGGLVLRAEIEEEQE